MGRRRPHAGGHVAGAWARFARDRFRVGAVVLVSLAIAASATVQSGAAAALHQTLDANWRGAYDILVTAPASAPTGDALPPNSLIGPSDARLSPDDVDAVRDTRGVEVAAPIAEVAFTEWSQGRLQLVADVDESKTTLDPRAYRVSVRFVTDDGLGERLVSSRSYNVVLDDSAAPTELVTELSPGDQCSIFGEPVTCEPYRYDRSAAWIEGSAGSWSGSSSTEDGRIELSGVEYPSPLHRVTLVDPAAERALLGDAGSFLDPLVDLGSGRAHTLDEVVLWADARPQTALTESIAGAAEWQRQQVAEFHASAQYQQYLRAVAARGEEPLPEEPLTVIPLLVSPQRETPLRVEIAVDALGPIEWAESASSFNPEWPAALVDAPGTPVGSVEADVSGLLDPFALSPVQLAWPGSDAETSAETRWLVGGISGVNTLVAPTGQTWSAQGFVPGLASTQYSSVSQTAVLGQDGTALGAQTAYSDFGTLFGARDGSGFRAIVPVAAFDARAVELSDDSLGYVPLGAYDPAVTTRVADGSGRAVEPARMLPSAGGLGLVGTRTSAIGDLGAIAEITSEPLVSAVRVRVAGVDRYDDAGIARVTRVAEALRTQGFAATIVAGSSPRTVRIDVDDYAFGTLEDPKQTVGPLGTVEQQWAWFGAAAKADAGVSASTQLLVGVVAAAVLALFLIVTLSSARRRRRDAASLRAAGWTAPRIAGWILSENAVGAGIVLVIGALALLVPGDRAVTATVVGVCAVIVLAAAVGTAVFASRAPRMRLATLDDLDRVPPEARISAGRRDAVDDDELIGSYDLSGYDFGAFDRDDAGAVGRAGRARGDAAANRAPRRRVPRRLGAHSPVGFGMRLLASDALGSLLRVLAVVVLMGTVIALAATLLDGRPPGSLSLIEEATRVQAFLPHLALGAIGILAGVLLAALLRSRELAARARSAAVLLAAGWTNRDIRTAERTEVLVGCLPAVVVAAYSGWFLLAGTGFDDPEPAIAAGVVTGLVATGVILFTRRKVVA